MKVPVPPVPLTRLPTVTDPLPVFPFAGACAKLPCSRMMPLVVNPSNEMLVFAGAPPIDGTSEAMQLVSQS